MFINKKVEYHSVNSRDLYKTFIYTNGTYSDDGLTINNSTAPQSDSTAHIETTSSYNHFFLRHNFYSIYNNTNFTNFSSNYAKQNNYVLQENARYISIPILSYGKKIYEGSVSIVDSLAGTFTDDACGNLKDTSKSTQAFVSESYLKCWFSFDDAYIKKQYPYKNTIQLRDNSVNLYTMQTVKAVYPIGISGSGYQIGFSGSGYAYIDNEQIFDFNNSDFTISFWLTLPSQQTATELDTNTIVSKRITNDGKYPFEISVYNQNTADNGKILVTRQGYKDRQQLQSISFTSSTAVNDSSPHHICFVKDSDTLKLYIDGVLENSISDYTNRFDASNSARVFIGARGNTATTIITSSYLFGSVDEFRVYGSAVSAQNLKNDPFNTNIVGSVFYEKGIIVFNNLSGSYSDVLTSDFTLTYKSVSELTEHEIVVKKGVGEFNLTMNPSIRNTGTLILNNNVSSSLQNGTFTPYITTIGLYDDKNRLLAVGKIKKPIKNINDIDLLFKIRFDM